MAIGANSVASEANTVSFGNSADTAKRLVYVAEGTADTDGVNVKQLNDTLANAKSKPWRSRHAGEAER